jgi:RNase H-fold protein (predicted Holliday junction resolvase)
MKILAISLGTRDSGVALLSQGQLIHWKTHTFHGTWSTDKLNDILLRFDRYITRYRIQHVVVKIPPPTHHSKAFLLLLKQLSELVQYRGCMVACHTKEDLKAFVPEVTNAMTLMSFVTRHYPILLPEQAQELASRQPYHIKMFEAVLAAHVYKGQSKKR